MKKLSKYLWLTALVLSLFCVGGLIADKQVLHNDLIRLHVVANSDSEEDQRIKLIVRDSVTCHLNGALQQMDNAQQAKEYLLISLHEIEQVAEETLQSMGCRDKVEVSLGEECFSRRDYETFSLPSGVYESLRVEIGDGEGKNWWCVLFPSLCVPATTESFVSAAVTEGMDQGLASTLSHEEGYEVRFYLLDFIGKFENFFHFG